MKLKLKLSGHTLSLFFSLRITAGLQRMRMLRAEKLQITQKWGMDVGSACSGSGFLGVKSMREVSYVSFSHDFHPQEAAAAARRPHIHTSVLCDLQLLCAEHPRPLQSSGNPAHHCNQRHLFSLEASNAVIPLFYYLAFGKVTK